MNPSNVVDTARLVFKDCLSLDRETQPETRFTAIREKFTDFVIRYPLVVKYMCVWYLYSEKYFIDLTEKINQRRPTHVQSLELQADYIKELLLELREKKVITLNRAQIKRIREEECNFAVGEFNKILKMEKQAKRELKAKDMDIKDDLRAEFYEFIKKNT